MKILAFAATNNPNSINRKLVEYAGEQLKSMSGDNLEVEIIDLNEYEMPIYRQDREKENGIPELAQAFYKKITEADKVMISFAEHNGTYSAAYKNVFDWVSRIDQKVYQQKPVLLMATSPGKRGGMGVLAAAETGGPHFGMDIKGKFSLPQFQQNFDAEKNEITNEELNASLMNALKEL